LNKYHDFIESLDRKIAPLKRERAMNTQKKRHQASSARCEGMNLESARDACLKLADAMDNGTLPVQLGQHFKTIKSICEATEQRLKCDTGYNAEYFLDYDNYRDTSERAGQLRLWLSDGDESNEEKLKREQQFKLEHRLSELRSASIPGFFPTPNEVITNYLTRDLSFHDTLHLDPSAGIGSICDEVRLRGGDTIGIEINYSLHEILQMKGHHSLYEDFTELNPVPEFDYVLMNPPFENNQAAIHTRMAYDWLKDDGVLRSIMPSAAKRYIESRTGVLREFGEWSISMCATWEDLPEGSFKNGFVSTGISCSVMTIRK